MKSNNDELVTLNVRGKRMMMYKSTLRLASFFGNMFDHRYQTSRQEDGAYFIDCDPDAFRWIMGYVETKHHPTDQYNPQFIKAICDKFGIAMEIITEQKDVNYREMLNDKIIEIVKNHKENFKLALEFIFVVDANKIEIIHDTKERQFEYIYNPWLIIEKEIMIKYISYNMNVRASKYNNRDILSGPVNIEKLSETIGNFINEVINCNTCGLPEIVIGKRGKKCNACGSINKLQTTNDKFSKFVDKYINKKSLDKKSLDKKKHKIENTVNEVNDSMIADSHSEVSWFSDTSPEAIEARRNQCIGNNGGLFK